MKTVRILPAVLAALLALCFAAAFAEEAAFTPADMPVVYIQIDGGQAETEKMNTSEDHSYRCSGTVDIAVPEGYGARFGERGSQESVQGLRLQYIRGRGNGTWNMAKLPYKIKLAEKQDLFGMGEGKQWVLLANYFDNSLLRNWLTEWVGEQAGLEYTPQGVFVDVVMNGEYLGCYYLCEQVRRGKNSVAIEELKAEDTELPQIQGGYLLEFSPDDWDSPDEFETTRGVRFGNMDPSFNPTDGGYDNAAQRDYIRGFVQQAEDAVFARDGSYTGYIDAVSLADYWWIMEFSANGDAFRTDSAHLYKKRAEADGTEGKLHFGPLWDFDDAWGCSMPEVVQTIGFNNTYFLWIDELRTQPEFLELLKERWQVLDTKLEELTAEGGALDRMAETLQDAWARDDARWHASHAEDGTDAGRNFEEEIALIRDYITLRRAWINENMDRLGLITFTLTVRGEGMEEETYDISCDTYVDLYMLEVQPPEGKELAGFELEDETPAVDFLLMDRDITLTVIFE